MKARWTWIVTLAGLSVFTLTASARPGSNRVWIRPFRPVTNRSSFQDLSAHALPWSKAQGRPAIEAGRSVGFFLWHDGDTVNVVTTDESDRGQNFAGKVRVTQGRISNPRGMKLDRPDRFRQVQPNLLDFHFDTHEATDGVRFTVHGGRFIVFNLRYQGHKTEHVFYGKRMIEAERDPLIFDLSR
jgi:hypothetical protein